MQATIWTCDLEDGIIKLGLLQVVNKMWTLILHTIILSLSLNRNLICIYEMNDKK